MARKYDNGEISAAIRDGYLAKVRSRMETMGMVKPDAPAEPSLEELMANFMNRVSKTRNKEELVRIRNLELHVPDESGLPEKVPYLKGVLPEIMTHIKFDFWEDMFDRTGAQHTASVTLGNAIDASIRKAGGSTAGIEADLAEYNTLFAVDRKVVEFRDAVAYVPFAVGINNLTVAGGAGKLANSSNAQRAIDKVNSLYSEIVETLEEAPDLGKKFPSMEVSRVGLFSLMASPITTDASEASDRAKEILPKIDEFREALDRWDVMEAYQQIWRDRATACQVHGLTAEAGICSQVADQYDRQYFEKIDKAWGVDTEALRI